jgi:hypothetical protein
VTHPISVPQDPQEYCRLLFVNLGALLIELYLNQSIRTTQMTWKALRLEADQRYQEHESSMPYGQLEAVRFCLHPRPAEKSQLVQFVDQEFREVYYQEVIAKLEADLREEHRVDLSQVE